MVHSPDFYNRCHSSFASTFLSEKYPFKMENPVVKELPVESLASKVEVCFFDSTGSED